jgi:hypothetical protein
MVNNSTNVKKTNNHTVSNVTFGDGDEQSPGTDIRSGENEVSWYNYAKEIRRCLIFFHPVKTPMLTCTIFIHSYDLHSELIR